VVNRCEAAILVFEFVHWGKKINKEKLRARYTISQKK